MKKRNAVLFLLGLFLAGWPCLEARSAHHWKVASPDGKIVVTIQQTKLPAPWPTHRTNLYYAVRLEGMQVIEPSPLGVVMEGSDGDFVNNLTFRKRSTGTINETYTLPSGKKRIYVNHANEIGLTFGNAAQQEMVLYVRAFDDGIAYRYYFPGAGEPRTILSEASGFKIPQNSRAWGQPINTNPKNQNHESMYRGGVVGKDFLTSEELWFPALFEIPNRRGWVLVTEAAVYGDYCASRLSQFKDGYFKVVHNRTAGAEDMVASHLPWFTPWRAAAIGKTLAPIIETSICENLNPPSETTDLSWIRPGRTSWTWWYASADMPDKAQNELFEKFATEEMGWEYGCGRGQMWYDWSGNYTDIRPGEGAKTRLSKGGSLAEGLDRELAAKAASGIVILKCDFMDSDSQERMKDYDLVALTCLRHKIMLNWHGARLPGGERRRWPNMIGYEGVLGAEHYKWSDGPTLFDRVCLPFTRNVVGPMDFTGVTFTGSATQKRDNSDAAELALAVLYENGISYWGDHPDAYRARPAAMSLLKKCPSAWEDTRFVAGYPGEFVCLARKSRQANS